MDYTKEELIVGPLSDLGLDSDADWQKAAELVFELNHTHPSESEKKFKNC